MGLGAVFAEWHLGRWVVMASLIGGSGFSHGSRMLMV
jgi:hypothetical protein